MFGAQVYSVTNLQFLPADGAFVLQVPLGTNITERLLTTNSIRGNKAVCTVLSALQSWTVVRSHDKNAAQLRPSLQAKSGSQRAAAWQGLSIVLGVQRTQGFLRKKTNTW